MINQNRCFFSNEDCGLPIGNLTSQLFSNVYLNVLDQYIKRVLHCKHYGRYVDDFYVVSKDKQFLKQITNKIELFIKNKLCLEIQKKKTHIMNIKEGVEFIGAYILPYRTYISNSSLKRIRLGLYRLQNVDINKKVDSIVNSYLGLFSHYNSSILKKNEMEKTPKLKKYGKFIGYYKKFVTE